MAMGKIGTDQFNYYASLNRAKLAVALQKNPRYQQQIQADGNVSAVQPVQKIDRVSLQKDLDFMEEYVDSMTGLMQASNDLRTGNRTGAMSDLTVTSSNTEVAEVSERLTLRTAMDLSVSVKQLAASQHNASQGVRGESLASADLDFTITDGQNNSLAVLVHTDNPNGVARTNRELLKEAADRINSRSDFGVRAYVEEREGISSLHLQSKGTGVKNGFHVAVEGGSLMGLDQEKTAAKDAVYSVRDGRTERQYQSATNQVTLDYGRVSMTLKGEGTGNISIQPDVERVSKSFSNLVDSYNQAITMLNRNQDRGTGVSMHQRSFQQGLAPAATLERIGISTKEDGTLILDHAKLETSLKSDPELTKQLIGGGFSIAQTAFNKANAALRTSSESLINRSQGAVLSGVGAMFGTYAGLGLIIDYLV